MRVSVRVHEPPNHCVRIMRPAQAVNSALRNRLFALLPTGVWGRVHRSVVPMDIAPGANIYRHQEPLPFAFYPVNGAVSLTLASASGQDVEVLMVGREGMIGFALALGTEAAPVCAFAHVRTEGYRIEAGQFRALMRREPDFAALQFRFVQAQVMALTQFGLCNLLHLVSQRCARWLLTMQDRLETDVLPITHEMLGRMLGVRRASVSLTIEELEDRGLVRAGRGHVRVLDRRGLQRASCECYGIIRSRVEQLIRAEKPIRP